MITLAKLLISNILMDKFWVYGYLLYSSGVLVLSTLNDDYQQ